MTKHAYAVVTRSTHDNDEWEVLPSTLTLNADTVTDVKNHMAAQGGDDEEYAVMEFGEVAVSGVEGGLLET